MNRHTPRLTGAALALGLLLAAAPAWAVITALIPLQAELDESQFILVATVETVRADPPALVLTVDEHLKGKAPLTRLPVNLRGDSEARKKKETPLVLKRVTAGLPLVLFVNRKEDQYIAFAYTNGTWFQVVGVKAEGAEDFVWAFTHCEPYLRRTYKGGTEELRQLIKDGLAGKKKMPAPDTRESPGLGPEVPPPPEKPAESAKPPAAAKPPTAIVLDPGPVFAVIPSVLVGGPLAVLAVLFPALFGGLVLVLRRWTAGLTVLSLNSTLYLVQGWCSRYLALSWWGTPQSLWLTMSVITLLGLLWAWRRHTRLPFEQPRRTELIFLVATSLVSLAALVYWVPWSPARMDLGDKTLVLLSAGVWAATLHAGYVRLAARGPTLPGEGVLLWAMLLAAVGLGTTLNAPPAGASAEATEPMPAQAGGRPTARFGKVLWRFRPNEPCWIASSPAVDGDRVFVGVVHGTAFRSGAVYCLDQGTGRVIWSFNNRGRMKDSFSSPHVAGGRVYVGEGFHSDADCKLYCLDADSGKLLWHFQTESHTESTPCVADGKVFFGAGDDGLYCLDAATGTPRWRLEGLHVDASPLVVGDRLYCGSGVGDLHKQTVLFCLETETGREQWRMPTDLPCWGKLAREGDHVYAGLGNGNFRESADTPAGAVLCLEAETGRRVWRYDAADSVLVRLAADRQHVYFAARDGHAYAVERRDGRLVWKTDLGSPVVASPALAGCPGCGGSASLYAAASAGMVHCLDPLTGECAWTFDLARDAGADAQAFSSPAVVVSHEEGRDRRRVFVGSGLNGFKRGTLYCLEDTLE